jgi:hypothetical protein
MDGAFAAGGMLMSLAIIALISLAIEAVFIFIGARLAGVYRVRFGTCFKAAFATVVVTLIAALVLSFIPVAGTGAGWLIGILISIFVIRGIFGIGFGKALLVWIFAVAAQIIAVILGLVILGGGLAALTV